MSPGSRALSPPTSLSCLQAAALYLLPLVRRILYSLIHSLDEIESERERDRVRGREEGRERERDGERERSGARGRRWGFGRRDERVRRDERGRRDERARRHEPTRSRQGIATPRPHFLHPTYPSIITRQHTPAYGSIRRTRTHLPQATRLLYGMHVAHMHVYTACINNHTFTSHNQFNFQLKNIFTCLSVILTCSCGCAQGMLKTRLVSDDTSQHPRNLLVCWPRV